METSIIVASIALAGTIATAIISAIISRSKFTRQEAVHLESRFNSIESSIEILQNKVEPVWNAIINEIPKLLIKDDTPKLDNLLKLASNGFSGMSEKQIHTMSQLLDVEYSKAIKTGDAGRAVGIALFRATIKERQK